MSTARPLAYGAIALLLSVIAPVTAHAMGGHYVVTDADIVEHGSCLVQTWYSHSEDEDSIFAVAPSCTFLPNLEVTAGAGFISGADNAYLLEGKTLFRGIEDGLGLGLVVGLEAESGRVADFYTLVPATLPLAGEHILWHVNLGYQRDREERRDLLVWGTGFDAQIREGLHAIAELYGNSRLIDERRERAFQAGLRLLPTAAVYVDLSYGRAIHNGDRWYTLGLGAEF
jgi:hypothetical protein